MVASAVAAVLLSAAFPFEPAVAEIPPVVPKPGEVARCIEGLSDPDAAVRIEAAAALVSFREFAAPAALPLAAALDDSSATVRLRAVNALEAIGPRAACVAAYQMRSRRLDESRNVRDRATEVYSDWDYEYDYWCSSITAEDAEVILRNSGFHGRAFLLVQQQVFPLGAMVETCSRLHLLETDHPVARRRGGASNIIPSEARDDKLLKELYAALVKDRELREQGMPGVEWAELISKIQPNNCLSRQLLPKIYPLLKEPERIRARALIEQAMRHVQPVEPSNVRQSNEGTNAIMIDQIILPALQSDNEELYFLARNLAEGFRNESSRKSSPPQGPLARLNVELSHLPRDVKTDRRARAIRALDPDAPGTLPKLADFARDPELDVQLAALQVLKRRSFPDTADILVKIIENERAEAEIRFDALKAYREVAERENKPLQPVRDLEKRLYKNLPKQALQQLIKDFEDLNRQVHKEQKRNALEDLRSFHEDFSPRRPRRD